MSAIHSVTQKDYMPFACICQHMQLLGAKPTWEHPAALSEGGANGAQAQNDMQVGANTLQEEGIQLVSCLAGAGLLGSWANFIKHPGQLILGEQVGDLACNSSTR